MQEERPDHGAETNRGQRGWRYHAKKPMGCLAVLPACMVYVCFFLVWLLYFEADLFISFIAGISPMVLIPVCILTAMYQLIKKNIRNGIFLLSPLLLLAILLIPPLDHKLTLSRYQTELFLQKHLYHDYPEIAAISDGKAPEITYKEWRIPDGILSMNFWIVYDATDEIVKQNGFVSPRVRPEIDGGGSIEYGHGPIEYEVYHLEGHFYMLIKIYQSSYAQ